MRLKAFFPLVIAILLGACAGSSTNLSARDYRRSEADAVRLKRLEVVVVVAGPPRVVEDRLDVQGFPPPELDAPLSLGAHEPETERALVRWLEQRLKAQGFEAIVHAQHQPIATVPRVVTSSLSPAPPPTPPPPALPESLRSVFAASSADAVLVLRAIPVDAFVIDVGTGTRLEETPLGRQQVRDYRPEKHEGRLLVGQAFLFDRQSKLRLWSRQAPDFPEEGRLTPDHPFLRFGYVASSTLTAPPSQRERAVRGAERFGAAILEGLPAASEGSTEARAALDALDPDAEAKRDAFFDQGHFAIDLAFAYGAETSQLELNLDQKPLATLDAGAFTPSGLLRAVPRVSYIASSGLAISASLPFGVAPSGFGRTYFADNANANLGDPLDRAIRTKITSSFLFGPELSLGALLHLTDSVFVLPRGGAFFEVWNVSATPKEAFPNLSRSRLGATVGADVWLRASETLYFRGAADLRVGADFDGPFLFGMRLSAGIGILL